MRSIFLGEGVKNPLENKKNYQATPQDSISYRGNEYDVVCYEKACKNPFYSLARAIFFTLIGLNFEGKGLRHLWQKGLSAKNVKYVYVQRQPIEWDNKFLFNRDDPAKDFDHKLQKAIQCTTKCAFDRINIVSFRKNSGQTGIIFAIDGAIQEHTEMANGRIVMDFMRFPNGKCLTIIAPQDKRRMRNWHSSMDYKLKNIKGEFSLLGRYLEVNKHKLYVMTNKDLWHLKIFSTLSPQMLNLVRNGS